MDIGKQLVNGLIDKVKRNLKENEHIMIQLLAANGKKEFYQKFGFKDKKETVDAGMYMWIKK